MPSNGITEVRDGLYRIVYYFLGAADVSMYLIAGEKSALLVDTGYVSTNVMQYVRQVTVLPLVVVNTHGHMDHIGGNNCFPEVFINRKDRAVARKHSDPTILNGLMDHLTEVRPQLNSVPELDTYRRELTTLSEHTVYYRDLPENGYFHLGNRDVEFLETPGHTLGSICLYDKKTGILLTGDTVCSKGVLLGFEESSDVKMYRETLYKLKSFCRSNNVKELWSCHHENPLPPSMIDRYITLCDSILFGEKTGSFKDTGTCSGLYVEDGPISMIYKEK
ncbi:MAG: MBL fold metallo-hydrolase [Oscillospiraceae bacterium]|nr:MBL fold metallo-hydrolase [Oscillospiraceae bacterium]